MEGETYLYVCKGGPQNVHGATEGREVKKYEFLRA